MVFLISRAVIDVLAFGSSQVHLAPSSRPDLCPNNVWSNQVAGGPVLFPLVSGLCSNTSNT